MAQEKLVQESGRGIFPPFPPLNLPAGFSPSRFGSGGNLEVGRSILERGKRIGGIRRKGVDSRRSFLAFDTFPTPPSLRLTVGKSGKEFNRVLLFPRVQFVVQPDIVECFFQCVPIRNIKWGEEGEEAFIV